MQNEDIIRASEFCMHQNIELSFIYSLKEYGLIETVIMDEQLFLPVSELGRLEKIIRLHFELEINLAGIESITHLLKRITEMQEHITLLTNRLKLYEE